MCGNRRRALDFASKESERRFLERRLRQTQAAS
jgi:hypothetical protein